MKYLQAPPYRKIIGLCGLFLLLQNVHAQFAFPVYEPFSEYPNNDPLGTAGTSGVNWTVGNSASSAQVITNVAAISYPGLQPDPAAVPLGLRGPTGVGRTREAVFTAQTSGTVYSSVLLNLQSLPTANRAIYGLTSANSGTPNPGTGSAGLWVDAAGHLLLSKNNQTTPATNTTVALQLNTTHLVAIAYTFVAGATTNDVVSLWLDPFLLGNNGNIPPPTFSITNGANLGADSTTIQGMVVYAGTGVPPMQTFYDEIRVDNNWAGVTPTGTSPGPSFAVTLTGTGSGCPGDAFPIGLSGSVVADVYLLYTNATFSGVTAPGTGSAITFAPQTTSAIYTVLASNITTAAVGWMTNGVAITVLASPAITTQPNPVTVATNGVAAFSVVSSGTGLKYQWYKNGTGVTDGGHLSGATTPTLTIFPATTADQASTPAGYYVIITNQCGFSAISMTNALTLDAPANLVWQGGNPNTNWDVATTLNWTNSAGTAVVFNPGDNVTFDSSSTNFLVTLSGGGIAPSVITENAGQNYFFTGSPLVGPSSLVMSGSGTLSISNDNNYTGGTVINSGVVAVKDANQLALGSGTVTMAGGKLEISLKSGVATIGISNNINVTASSTLQYDGAGSLAFDLFGRLDGSPSATLTIQGFLNNSATPDRMRLYGNFTNNAPIAINTAGDMMELAPYNPAGLQVYNGIISGSGGRFVLRGAGSAVFNGANAFNDSGVNANGNGPGGYSVLISGGNLGVGADSSGDFSAYTLSGGIAAGSSPLGTGTLGINSGPSEGGSGSIFASGGAHTVANPIIYTTASTNIVLSITGNNDLTLSGTFNLNGADNTGGTNRTIQVNNTGLTTFSGVVGDAGLVCGLTKTGTNILVLSTVNTYTGPTTVGDGTLWVNGQIDVGAVAVTNGSLGGIGTILGVVSVQSPGALAPGTKSIGTLTVNNNLTLAGNALFKVNKSLAPAQSNDIANVSGALSASGTGTLTVSNLGPALVIGDSFKLFNKAVTGGSALTVTGGGMNWMNKLAVDGSIQALSVASTVNTNATNIVFHVTGNVLALSWPADHTGFRLQMQTNALSTGLRTNWTDMAGSTSVNSTNITINPANGAVFYRLVYP